MNEKIFLQRWAPSRRCLIAGAVLGVSMGTLLPAMAAEDETAQLNFVDSLYLEPASQRQPPWNANEPALRQALAEVSSDRTDKNTQQLRAFYDQLDNAFVWQRQDRVNALLKALRELKNDGLMVGDYDVEGLSSAYQISRSADAAGKAAFDLDASRQLLSALNHLQTGKTNPAEVIPGWDGPEHDPLPLDAITERLLADDIAGGLDLVRPQQAHYQQLRQALADYRGMQQSSVAFFPARDEALRQGDQHPDVKILRQRLAYWGDIGPLSGLVEAYPALDIAHSDPALFDSDLTDAVKRFQRRHLLKEDGVVGRNTREALNASIASRIDQLRVNLERARWLAPAFEQQPPRLWVDLAGYSMVYLRPDGERWRSRVVVGTAERETPVIHSKVTHLTINPSWTLPPTIMREDVLPKVRLDPGYLQQRNMQVIDYSGQPLTASEIDWDSPGNIMIRQPSDTNNPLGRVVIRFPNSDMIYLHDTPSRGLFGRDRRALSSGCVRVEGVEELAQMLLEDTGSRHQFRALKRTSRSDIQVNLPEQIPVALHYVTAWPDEQGKVTFRKDIYQRDDHLLAALNE